MMAYEEEKLKLETVRRVREEEKRLKEEFRKKKISERLKQKQEKGTLFVCLFVCFWIPIAFSNGQAKFNVEHNCTGHCISNSMHLCPIY